MEEIWKDIKGYEGLYQVSNIGRVRGLRRNIILKPKVDRLKYLFVGLQYKGKGNNYRIHRLVALHFLENPNNFKEVNHKDEDKANNCVGNLEWCTHKYNSSYGTRGKRISLKNTNGKKSKITLQYDINGNLIKEWCSVSEITRKTIYKQGHISRCCRKECKTAYGYVWRYKNEED